MAAKKASSSPRKKSTASKVSKAEKEAQKAEIERIKNSKDYPALAGLLAVAPYKTLATLEWLNERMPENELKLENVLKKEKERFILAVVRNQSAEKVVNDLKNAPSQKWKEFMVEISRLSSTKAEEKLKALKPKEFAALIEVYDIEPVRTGRKKNVSKAKTIERVMEKLTEIREHLKL